MALASLGGLKEYGIKEAWQQPLDFVEFLPDGAISANSENSDANMLYTWRREGGNLYKLVQVTGIGALTGGTAVQYSSRPVGQVGAFGAGVYAGVTVADIPATVGIYLCWIQLQGPINVANDITGTPSAGQAVTFNGTDRFALKTLATQPTYGVALDVTPGSMKVLLTLGE